MSTQPYLSTSPRQNAERLVPFSHTISARPMCAASFTESMPPSPLMMFLVSWNEKAAKCPSEPRGLPL
jgi:hypothetical protein